MTRARQRRLGALPCLIALAAVACGSTPPPLDLALAPATGQSPAIVRVTGLAAGEVAALRRWRADGPEFRALLAVWVDGADASTPIAGRYVVSAAGLEFHPQFPFDPGRTYRARLSPARLPAPRDAPDIETTLRCLQRRRDRRR